MNSAQRFDRELRTMLAVSAGMRTPVIAALTAMWMAGCVGTEEQEPLGDPNGLPDCASPQMQAIFQATRQYLPKGSVSDELAVTSHNTADAKLLLDGPQIFPAFHELIAGAQRDVNLQTYVWEPGSEPAQEIVAGLADLNRRRAAANAPTPVKVRFLFDVSTIGYGSEVVLLPQAWAEVAAVKLDPRYVQFELAGVIRSAVGVLHKKTLIVDGEQAIITGANPQAHHDYEAPWRDSGYKLSGEIALALQEDFDDGWSAGKLWTCGGDEAAKLTDCSIATAPIVREPVQKAYAGDDRCLPMLVTSRAADTNPVANSISNPQDQAFLAAFASATRVIRIQSPNLNDDAAKAAIVDAVKRGVRVDVVLAKGFNDSSEIYPGQGGTNEENVQMLYDAVGGRSACDKLRIRWHTQDGVVVVGNGEYASHAKYTSVDDSIVIVGTANMDTQSWNNSREVNVIVDSPEITKAWDQGMFLNEMANGAVVDPCK